MKKKIKQGTLANYYAQLVFRSSLSRILSLAFFVDMQPKDGPYSVRYY